ncbi:LysR family transcriptional regulator [uncultured Ferrovibrio sp.]|jgi:Transcriptional regulator|uniref:LysR family transcriptional regulator n=1 Tax=uncultured Ferrovibrio sp. TaxID=1576913 RepID=UPI002605EDD4|nr:LysR family transcriptional regulator [uncultured Ferrovibrio sp.]
MDHLADLAVFARVVEANSFSAAAASLRLSKSAVSKQIARLEERLGAQLLQRTTRKLTLTETGRIVLDHAQRVLIEAEAAEAAVQNLQTAPRGQLRVNLPMSFGLAYVTPLLPELLSKYPELHIDLTFNDRRVDLLEEDVDVAIRIGELADSTLTVRRLAPARFITCASEAYLRKAGVPLKPSDLQQHECLIYKYLPEPFLWRYEGPGGPWSVKVSGRLHANNGEALRDAAVAGHGVVRSPSFIVGPDIAAGRLVPILEAYEPASFGIYAVYPAQRYLTPKLRAFIDFLVERFGPRPPWECVLVDTVERQRNEPA